MRKFDIKKQNETVHVDFLLNLILNKYYELSL